MKVVYLSHVIYIYIYKKHAQGVTKYMFSSQPIQFGIRPWLNCQSLCK